MCNSLWDTKNEPVREDTMVFGVVQLYNQIHSIKQRNEGVSKQVRHTLIGLFSRPLKVLLISDIQQISLRKPLINLQVFLSL